MLGVMAEKRLWPPDEDRTYHGLHDDAGNPGRILVERTEFGPTERMNVPVLRVLTHPRGMSWGYNGAGTSRAAAAMLADALDIDRARIDVFPTGGDQLLVRLRQGFCEDVLSQLCDEFRLRRGAVLRWVKGWCADTKASMIIPTVPIDRLAYRSAPPTKHWGPSH